MIGLYNYLNYHLMLQNKEWQVCTSIVNYWNTHKPVCFVTNYVLSVTQLYCVSKEQHESTPAIYQAITGNTKDSLMMHVPRISMRALHISMCECHTASISAISSLFNRQVRFSWQSH